MTEVWHNLQINRTTVSQPWHASRALSSDYFKIVSRSSMWCVWKKEKKCLHGTCVHLMGCQLKKNILGTCERCLCASVDMYRAWMRSLHAANQQCLVNLAAPSSRMATTHNSTGPSHARQVYGGVQTNAHTSSLSTTKSSEWVSSSFSKVWHCWVCPWYRSPSSHRPNVPLCGERERNEAALALMSVHFWALFRSSPHCTPWSPSGIWGI